MLKRRIDGARYGLPLPRATAVRCVQNRVVKTARPACCRVDERHVQKSRPDVKRMKFPTAAAVRRAINAAAVGQRPAVLRINKENFTRRMLETNFTDNAERRAGAGGAGEVAAAGEEEEQTAEQSG